jgi:hypothetical protein
MLQKPWQIWQSIRSWMVVIFQGLLVLLVILAGAYAIMLLANLWPLFPDKQQCPWVFPKIMSCVLGSVPVERFLRRG